MQLLTFSNSNEKQPLEDMLKEHHIDRFTDLIKNLKPSPNKYNKCDFSDILILESGSLYPEAFRSRFSSLASGRECGDMWDKIISFASIMAVSGFIKMFPVIIDRNGALVDGYQRYHACRLLEMEIHYVILDFDSSAT